MINLTRIRALSMPIRGSSPAAAVVLLVLIVTASQAGMTNQHSVEAIQQAIASPIPDSAVQEARKYDDQLLGTGIWEGVKIYLVTDERAKHVLLLAQRVLAAIGEDPKSWVVRVLDSDPKVNNAFVAGGKYIYIFTGLTDQAQSDDELGFVLGHELGHSVLKHNLRRENDFSSTLANLAALVAAATKGGTQHEAQRFAETIRNTYSQVDEREADAFGVIVSSRAGLDPLRGADFFSRGVREEDEAFAARDQTLQEAKESAESLKAECESLQQQWASGAIAQTRKNEKAINERCAAADAQVDSFNQALAQVNSEDQARQAAKKSSDHPDDQERVAAVAALTDYVNGIRPIESLELHEQAQRVITALVRNNSALLKPPTAKVSHDAVQPAAPAHATAEDIAAKLKAVREMHEKGLINQHDYEKKKQELLNQL